MLKKIEEAEETEEIEDTEREEGEENIEDARGEEEERAGKKEGEEGKEKGKEEGPETPSEKKKLPGKWFRKIPKEILLSPGGMVLIFFALIMEIIDLIPVPVVDNLWELPLELIFIGLLAIIAKIPWQSMITPLAIERIPAINDIVPTWLIRMLF